jgi:formyl-CoA transferase
VCAELGKPELAEDRRFLHNADRLVNRAELDQELEALLAEVDGVELCDRLLEIGVPAGPILDVAQLLEHPHTRHREMLAELGDYRGWGLPIKFSRTPGEVRRRPPKFGAEGREILAESGFTDEEIAELAENGVIVEERRRA